MPMEGGEANIARGGQTLDVLWLHNGATPDSAVEVTVDLNCKTVLFNQLFDDIMYLI